MDFLLFTELQLVWGRPFSFGICFDTLQCSGRGHYTGVIESEVFKVVIIWMREIRHAESWQLPLPLNCKVFVGKG